MAKATTAPGRTLLNPDGHTLMMIDDQSHTAFATASIDGVALRNNVALANAAKARCSCGGGGSSHVQSRRVRGHDAKPPRANA
jgi:hypothetical protein